MGRRARRENFGLKVQLTRRSHDGYLFQAEPADDEKRKVWGREAEVASL
jgi:hypothetical protein